MKLLGIIYKNDQTPDEDMLKKMPAEYQTFLKQANGLIAFKGGLHLRGCCNEPLWHSIAEAWEGKNAFWKYYPEVLDIDIPFGQDCMGDQFLFRNEKVIKLSCETGEVELLNLSFFEFISQVTEDPLKILGLHPLIQVEAEGKSLQPGELIQAYPPFTMNPGGIDITLKIVKSEEQISFLQQVFRQRQRSGDEGFSFVVG
ncbi:MAG: SMI1/KNR4 family protein [Cytophagaceae bacterium]